MIILSYRATDLFETGEGGHDQSLTKNKLMIFLKIFILMLQSAYTLGIPATDTYSQYGHHNRDLRRNEDRFTDNYRNNIKRNHHRRSTIRSVGRTLSIYCILYCTDLSSLKRWKCFLYKRVFKSYFTPL